MLKKILGEAPFDIELCESIVVSPDKTHRAQLVFRNDSEYDLPLSCNIKMDSFVAVDRSSFDVILPAEGVTSVELAFSVPATSKIFGGSKICELEIVDRIFDSRTEYEFEVSCELSYKCENAKNDAFSPSENVFFSRDGRIYANKGETVCLEIPSLEQSKFLLHVVSGKIKNFNDGEIITVTPPLCRLCFEMQEDGSFEFQSPESLGRVYPDTLNPRYFI